MRTRRVVVTGIGVISPAGRGLAALAGQLRSGRPAFRFGTVLGDYPPHRTARVAEVDGPLEPDAGLAPPADRCRCLALIAARDAWADSGIELGPDEAGRVGVCLGTNTGPTADLMAAARARARGEEPAPTGTPYLSPALLSEVAACIGARGDCRLVHAACASGTVAIGLGADLIRSGRCDVVLAGGADGHTEVITAGFRSAGSVSADGCRPFDRQRDGMTPSEGAAFLVLEELERALRRGRRPYAEVYGYGTSNDAYHLTAPHPSGAGLQRALEMALTDAGVAAQEVTYLNIHGTGTLQNDPAELAALQAVFGPHLPHIPITAAKSVLGHTMGAAGALAAVACIAAMVDGMVYPTAGVHSPLDDSLDLVPEARPHRVSVAVSTSLGFGGQNAALVLGRWEAEATPCSLS